MKIPKEVNILGHFYKVKIVNQKDLPFNTAGVCEYPNRVIKLSKELMGEMRYLIFLHEVWHGVQFESGDTQILQAQVQEKHCERFASVISSLKKQKVI